MNGFPRRDPLDERHQQQQQDELLPMLHIPPPYTIDAIQVELELHPNTWIAFSSHNAPNQNAQWWLMQLSQMAGIVTWVVPKDKYPYRVLKRS